VGYSKTKEEIRLALRPYYHRVIEKKILRESPHRGPDFIIIGTKKGGTTSLSQYLAKHPLIIAPKKKEAAYFTWGRKQGLKRYLQNFPLKESDPDCLSFEATPSYLYLKKAPRGILRVFPQIKLIAILRDPVKRAYSDWTYHHNSTFIQERSRLRDSRTFNQAVEEELKRGRRISWIYRYIDKGIYVKQLAHWYNYVPRQRLLILDSEELKHAPRVALTRVTDFLGLPPYYEEYEKGAERIDRLLEVPDEDPAKTFKAFNVNHYEAPMDPGTEQFLRAFYAPFDKQLVRLTGQSFSWIA
jgi:hypothetical protein